MLLYIDIIQIFLYLLQLLGNKDWTWLFIKSIVLVYFNAYHNKFKLIKIIASLGYKY